MGKIKDKLKKIDWKYVLGIIFPIIPIFTSFKSEKKGVKETPFKGFWNTTLGWSIKLYSLTLVIPIATSVLMFMWFILGLDMKYPLLEGIFRSFSDFYVTGSLLSISAWRWQILLFLISLGITASQ